MRIILASASPRRKELLQKLFQEFEIIPAQREEIITKELPAEVVQELSAAKAAEIEHILSTPKESPAQCMEYMIIGADTVVAWNNKILGKPRNAQDAEAALNMLSGNTHQVYTGVTVICQKDGKRKCTTFAECTDVKLYPMSPEEIRQYVQTKEPMDKAGSYGIQGIGGRFVEAIAGDYNNVVGLPVARLYQILKQYPVVISFSTDPYETA